MANSVPNLVLSTPCSRSWDLFIVAVVPPHPSPRQLPQGMVLWVGVWAQTGTGMLL